nr:3-dehydroquinate dehydratase [Chitinophagaceae bacterium]
PNLNFLGKREPGIYGNKTWDDFFESLKKNYPSIEFYYYQSNVQGELINALQDFSAKVDAIILNAGAYTHTSIAIGDCIKSLNKNVIEVHISNTFAREDFRQISFIAPHCNGSIIGFGMKSYTLAVQSLFE